MNLSMNVELEMTNIEKCASCKLQSVLKRLRVNQSEERYMRARTERMSAEISAFITEFENALIGHA